MIEDLKIVIVGYLMLIGKFQNGVLHNPRSVHAAVDKRTGESMLVLQELVATPKSIEIHQAVLSYDVTDDTVMALYIRSTTGLVMARNAGNQ